MPHLICGNYATHKFPKVQRYKLSVLSVPKKLSMVSQQFPIQFINAIIIFCSGKHFGDWEYHIFANAIQFTHTLCTQFS